MMPPRKINVLPEFLIKKISPRSDACIYPVVFGMFLNIKTENEKRKKLEDT